MLVTAQDLVTYMDISLSLRQQDAADMVLAGLQSELETYLRRPIEVTEFIEEHRVSSFNQPMPMSSFFYNHNLESSFYTSQGNSQQSAINYAMPPETVYLRNSPVVSVSEVKVKPINGTEQTLVAERDYVVRRYGIDVYLLLADDLVTVTYEAGLDGEAIPFFKLLILRAATREMQNMHDDVVGIKDLESRNVAPLETGFTERELMSVKKYRRTRVA
jgi:hypothetical protein